MSGAPLLVVGIEAEWIDEARPDMAQRCNSCGAVFLGPEEQVLALLRGRHIPAEICPGDTIPQDIAYHRQQFDLERMVFWIAITHRDFPPRERGEIATRVRLILPYPEREKGIRNELAFLVEEAAASPIGERDWLFVGAGQTAV